MSIIPPLIFFHYTPYSMEGTTLNNGKLNSAFFNTYKSIFGTSTNILLNSNPTKFSSDTVCSTCNKFAKLFLNNHNDTLSNPIGNTTNKSSYLKLQQLKNIYNISGFFMFNIYNENQFNFGTIVCNLATQNFNNIADANGNRGLNSVNKAKIIFANGYYDYLNDPFSSNIQNEIIVEITNGIRKVIIPEDPTGKYIPKFITIDLKKLVPTLYYPPFNSTFVNSELVMEEYNLSTGLYLDSSITVKVGVNNILSVINKNIFDNNLDEAFFLALYSVNKTSPLINSGNILGLITSYNYDAGSTGFTNKGGTILPEIILYADGDFDYLNYSDNLNRFNTIAILVNPDNTRTLYFPPKPINFVPPPVVYPDNFILPDKIIYNVFYSKPGSNSSIYDNNTLNQNITIFSELYDSYDPITELFGNEIGKLILFKFIFTSNNQTYTSAICFYSFFNNEYITSTYVLKNGLDKNGSLVQNQNIKSTDIASSDGYGFDSYFTDIKTFKNYYSYNVGYVEKN